jgi:hypothetical protein
LRVGRNINSVNRLDLELDLELELELNLELETINPLQCKSKIRENI